jgi:hypothetical protein
MNSTLAKLNALKDRVASVQGLHSSIPIDIFISLRDQFLKEMKKLIIEFSDLADFTPQNYQQFLHGKNSYLKFATRALIADIEYFTTFLTKIETVQTPNVKVSDEGVFFAGQHFDALLKFNDIISKATKEIILIDNYLSEKILELLANKNDDVLCRVLTNMKSITSLNTFIEAFNIQHKNLAVKTTNAFHDRFVVIDQTDFYHFGASIKDAGKKGFMFSKIEQDFIKEGLLKHIEIEWKR